MHMKFIRQLANGHKCLGYTDFSIRENNKRAQTSPMPTTLLPKAQSSLQNKGTENI